MPTDRRPPAQLSDPPTEKSGSEVAEAVLAILSGIPLATAASAMRMDPADLEDAVASYRAAGSQALETRAADHGWYSARVIFPGEELAEMAAARSVGPSLDRLMQDGVLEGWWFVRGEPYWRLRLHPAGGVTDAAKAAIHTALNECARAGSIARWGLTLYEAETASLGGPAGLRIAHHLFCADTRHFLSHLREECGQSDRGALSMRLGAALLRAAGLGPSSQGEVWHYLSELCPLPGAVVGTRPAGWDGRGGLPADCGSGSAVLDGSATGQAAWADAFRHAGHQLQQAATAGSLRRGPRHVAAHLLLGHWNRVGLSAARRAVLSRAARDAHLPGIPS